MEKEKKKVKSKTKEKTNSDNEVVFTKDVKNIIKVGSLLLVFIASIAAIFVFVFGIITSIKVSNITKAELLHDNFSVTFISNINNISISEAEDLVQGYGSKALFILFDIVVPAIAIISIAVITIVFIKKLMDFITSTKKEKELYTKDKLASVEKMCCLLEIVLTIDFIIFNNPSMLIYILTSTLLFIVIGLFRKCVENNKK